MKYKTIVVDPPWKYGKWGSGSDKALVQGDANKPKLFKQFKEFLADECFDLKEYKAGKYDRKIFNWFMKVTLN